VRVALVTWQELPNLSDDDRGLLAPLERLGISAVPAVWTDPKQRWEEYDALVVRSTWDYHRRYDEFLVWIDTAGDSGRLWNPARVLRWNSHKSYLRALSDEGVSVVPTRYCPDLAAARETILREGWSDAVVKAAVSAGGYRTYRVNAEALDGGPGPWEGAPPIGELLVQPYEPEVERSGERSLVFLRGEFSHAFLRAPRLARGSPLVEGAPLAATPGQIAVARRALACAPGPTLYGRVDLVADAEGGIRVMELEVLEPALELGSARGGHERLANAIAEVLGSRGRRKPAR
jgi:hypothetical protein